MMRGSLFGQVRRFTRSIPLLRSFSSHLFLLISLILTLLFATFWSHEDLLLPKETYRSRSCPRAQQVWAGFRVGLGWKFDRTSVSCTGFVKQVRDSSISRQRGHPWLPTQPREKERKKGCPFFAARSSDSDIILEWMCYSVVPLVCIAECLLWTYLSQVLRTWIKRSIIHQSYMKNIYARFSNILFDDTFCSQHPVYRCWYELAHLISMSKPNLLLVLDGAL